MTYPGFSDLERETSISVFFAPRGLLGNAAKRKQQWTTAALFSEGR